MGYFYFEEPQDIDLLWPDPERGPWGVKLWFGWLEGRWECVGLELRSQAHTNDNEGSAWGRLRDAEALFPTRLTTATLREFALGQIVDEARSEFRDFYRMVADGVPVLRSGTRPDDDARAREQVEKNVKATSWESATPRRGRKGYGPQHFVNVATVYRDALAVSDAPTKAVADHFSVTKSAAAKWVARARTMRLLPPARKGYPG